MLTDSDIQRLSDMRQQARLGVEISHGRTEGEFLSGEVLALALERLLTLIGEAAAPVSDDARELCPRVPWPQVVGIRNRLIHGYADVDRNVVWRTVREDLPALIDALEAVLGPASDAAGDD